MKCNELETNAIAYVDGKLAPPRRAGVEAHLAVCAACRERVRGFAQVMGLLDEWPAVQPSPFFETRLAARLQEEPASRSWGSSLWQTPDFRPTGSLAAVVLAVVVTVAVAVLRYSPAPAPLDAAGGADSQAVAVASADDLPLYQDLPLLEDYEVLRNFDVLQVLNSPTPGQ